MGTMSEQLAEVISNLQAFAEGNNPGISVAEFFFGETCGGLNLVLEYREKFSVNRDEPLEPRDFVEYIEGQLHKALSHDIERANQAMQSIHCASAAALYVADNSPEDLADLLRQLAVRPRPQVTTLDDLKARVETLRADAEAAGFSLGPLTATWTADPYSGEHEEVMRAVTENG
jgi:hypothetical protein